ncbi:MAG: hypothetical protein GF355_14665 [Candidatus Eisenbacteria bacterium]|nr:hypothetical protein [Candidatus Eisenbacteria bacterium]
MGRVEIMVNSNRKLLAFMLPGLLSGWLAAGVAQSGSSCIDCHAALDDEVLSRPAELIEQDIHIQRDLSCEDCHGGNPDRGFEESDPSLAHSAEHGWRGVPRAVEIPEFCARCHSDVEFMKEYNPKLRVDQLLEYRSSHHGKLLAQGDAKVAQCVSCHGVHGMLPTSDTRSPVYHRNIPATCGECHADPDYMSGYDIPSDQLEEYRGSIHGKLLLEEGETGAPACNDCHGNHGAAPPGLASVANACGECHAINRDYFNQSPHAEAFEVMGLAECIACHGSHAVGPTSDAMVGVHDDAQCMECHGEGDGGYEAAQAISAQLDTLKTELETAGDLLDRAEQGGVDVKRGKFDLQEPKSALIKARGAVHYFDAEKVKEITQPAITQARRVQEYGEEALEDLRMRHVGLAFSIPLILLVALALYLAIRRMEGRRKSS